MPPDTRSAGTAKLFLTADKTHEFKSLAFPLRRVGIAIALWLGVTALVMPLAGNAADLSAPFDRYTLVFSAEGGFSHFGSRLNSTFVQTWDLATRFSILPFAPFQMELLWGALDGSLEVGLQPTFQRFETIGQNFGGMGLAFRYYLLHWRVGRFVPYANVSAAPGGTDLDIPRLRGPFMFLIQAGAGFSYFVNERTALYIGYQIEHVSNAYTYGTDAGLDSPGGAVFGISYFFH
jgi:hypothetical protein